MYSDGDGFRSGDHESDSSNSANSFRYLEMMNRDSITTTMEILGGVLIVVGVSAFSVPVGVIVAGVLLILAGGLAV